MVVCEIDCNKGSELLIWIGSQWTEGWVEQDVETQGDWSTSNVRSAGQESFWKGGGLGAAPYPFWVRFLPMICLLLSLSALFCICWYRCSPVGRSRLGTGKAWGFVILFTCCTAATTLLEGGRCRVGVSVELRDAAATWKHGPHKTVSPWRRVLGQLAHLIGCGWDIEFQWIFVLIGWSVNWSIFCWSWGNCGRSADEQVLASVFFWRISISGWLIYQYQEVIFRSVNLLGDCVCWSVMVSADWWWFLPISDGEGNCVVCLDCGWMSGMGVNS